jgi:hypothetical protein
MIYLLSRASGNRATWEEVRHIAIRASSELHARQLASSNCGEEGPAIWLDSITSTCEAIDPNGPPQVICTDYIED